MEQVSRVRAIEPRRVKSAQPPASGREGFPVERQQFVQPIQAMRIDAPEYVLQVSEGFHTVQLASFDEREDRCRGAPTSGESREQPRLAPVGDGADRALHEIAIRGENAILGESGEGGRSAASAAS